MAFSLGTAASVLFVSSHLPQLILLLRGRPGAQQRLSSHMVGLQLVSGILWIAYGAIENALTVLVFASLSTAFRLVILSLTAARRALSPTAHRVTVLAGGGELGVDVWDMCSCATSRSRAFAPR